MTPDDLAIIARGITPVLRERTEALWQKCNERLKTIETRASVPGPPGERGERGEPGERGADGVVPPDLVASAVADVVAPITDRLKALESQEPIPGPPGEPGAPGERGADGTVPAELLAAAVTEAIVPIVQRMTALEQREIPPGRDGEPGRDGKDADLSVIIETHAAVAAVREEVAVLKATRAPDLDLDDLEQQAAVCCEKAFSLTTRVPDRVSPARVQKRVIRDGDGRVERIVHEAVT